MAEFGKVLRKLSGLVPMAALCAGLGFALTPAQGAQETYNLNFASYIGKGAAQSKAAEWWAKEVEKRTDGRVKIKFFYQGALLPAADILRGVGEGRADLGYVANAYHPAELPLSSVVGVPFITSNAEAQMRTFQELYERNEAFHNEWEKQGVHVLFFNPLSENIVGMREPVAGVADLKGKSIRGLGYINQVLQIIGANPVAIAAPEIYEALQRKTIDGYSGFAFEVVTALKLNEVAPHTIATGTGNYVFAATPITKSLWDKMPADIKKIMTDVSTEYMSKVVEILHETEDEVCTAIKKGGGTVGVLPQADIDSIRAKVGDQINDRWVADTKSRGVDAAPFFADYRKTLAKYEKNATYVSGVKRCAEAN
jgi:TRAP-type C4-dicarboxylate transport system substrate-binding protein